MSWAPLIDYCASSKHETELQFAKDWVLETRLFAWELVTYCILESPSGTTITLIPGTREPNGDQSYYLSEGGKMYFDLNGDFLRYVSGI